MIDKNTLTPIGETLKTHGIAGEILCKFSVDIETDEGLPQYLLMEDEGIVVPIFVESLRGRNLDSMILKLEGIDSDRTARRFLKKEILTDQEIVFEDFTSEGQLQRLVGFRLIDEQYGDLGELTGIDTSTINTLFEVGERLIPAHDEFIREIDTEKRIIRTALPDGILDI